MHINSDHDLTPEVTHLITLATKQARTRGVLHKVAEMLVAADPVELAEGVTQTELGRRAGVTGRSVRRGLRQLEALGAVESIPRPGHRLGYRIDADRFAVILEALN